jgi:hypothetical protein
MLILARDVEFREDNDKEQHVVDGQRPLEEVVTARPTAPFDPKWGGFLINGSVFTGLVYEGV